MPKEMYAILKQGGRYQGTKQIIVSKNGAAFPDKFIQGKVQAPSRIDFFRRYLQNLLKANAKARTATLYSRNSITLNGPRAKTRALAGAPELRHSEMNGEEFRELVSDFFEGVKWAFPTK